MKTINWNKKLFVYFFSMKRAFDYQRDKSFKITVNTDRSNKSDSKMSDIDRRMAENDRKMREIAEKWVDLF